MLRTFNARNFRLFRDVKLESLERVNLITGANGSGKTALLEAILVLLGRDNPELSVTLNAQRGMDIVVADPAELWGWLFRGRNMETPISISAGFENKETISVEILIRPSPRTETEINSVREQAASEQPRDVSSLEDKVELIHNFKDRSGKKGTSKTCITGGEIKNYRGELNRFGLNGVLLHSKVGFGERELHQFSQLESEGRQELLVGPLQMLEPRLKRLALLYVGKSVIFGDIGIGRLVPLSFMGEGIARLLRIITNIVGFANGVVLIDEIENGFHHSVLETVWKTIGKVSRDFNTQVFATTHSWECIQAAHKAFSKAESYDLALYRLDPSGEEIKVHRFDQETLGTSMELNMEVR